MMYYKNMGKITHSDGTVHSVPEDLAKSLSNNSSASERWESLTPLARNEWICWCITVKQPETRTNHIERTIKELQDGKRRPCCWIGCIHRTDKPISVSVQGVLNERSDSK